MSALSSGERKLQCSGNGGTTGQQAMLTKMVTQPSMMKILLHVNGWIDMNVRSAYHLHAPYPAVPSILAMSDETNPLIAPATIPAVQKKTYRVRYSRLE